MTRTDIGGTGARVVVAGSLNLDHVVTVAQLPAPGETVLASGLELHDGGKGGNQAHTAARAAASGTRVAMVACVGADAAGERMTAALAAHGVDVSAVRTVAVPSGQAFIATDPSGENTIAVAAGANFAWPDEAVDELAFDEDARGGGVLVLQLEIPMPTVRRLVRRAHEAGWRVVLNAAPPQPLPDDLLRSGDVLVVNEHEALVVLGAVPDPASTAAPASSGGCDVVVTLGAAGALVRAAATGAVSQVPAYPVTATDTVGAGDAFVGALAVALAEGAGLDRAVRLGAASGALTATVAGARHPTLTRAMLDALVAAG